MYNIKKLLSKWEGQVPEGEEIKKILSEVVLEATKKTIDPKAISIKENQVFIRVNSIVKTELFLKKQKILEEINKKANKKIVNIQ